MERTLKAVPAGPRGGGQCMRFELTHTDQALLNLLGYWFLGSEENFLSLLLEFFPSLFLPSLLCERLWDKWRSGEANFSSYVKAKLTAPTKKGSGYWNELLFNFVCLFDRCYEDRKSSKAKATESRWEDFYSKVAHWMQRLVPSPPWNSTETT